MRGETESFLNMRGKGFGVSEKHNFVIILLAVVLKGTTCQIKIIYSIFKKRLKIV